MDVDVERELGPVVAVGDALQDLTHVRGAGQRQQTALAVERLGDLGFGESRMARKVQNRARVDGARARGHDQALERGEAHRGVHRTSAPHGGERRAGAEVAGHHLQLVG